MGISTLRTLFSVAWVGGPPLAALVLAQHGFVATYGMAAAMYVIAAVVVLFGLPEVGAAEAGTDEMPAAATPAARRTIMLVVAGFVAVQVTTVLGVQAMPLFVTADLGGSVRDAGLILGLCAALEIPLMLGFGALAARLPSRRLILFGVLAAIGYQALATVTTTVWLLAAAQLLNAAGIATVSGLGISYAQDLMPDRPGQATTMITNTFIIGQILAGPLFGVAQHFGFRLAYGMNLGLCVVGLLLLIAAGRDKIRPRPGPQVIDGA
jgi:SET family sugar efflux transporter-like MFS transporter